MKFLSSVSMGGVGLIIAGLILYINPDYTSLPTALVITGGILVLIDIYLNLSSHVDRFP